MLLNFPIPEAALQPLEEAVNGKAIMSIVESVKN